jgi:uncharacterized protein (TIGR03435 family)
MVQALLGDRFKLKLHRETREIPVYALLVGKGGPGFGKAVGKAAEGTPRGVNIAAGLLVAHDATMAEFADVLTTNPGLKLEAHKAPVEMLVIDSADRPSGN